METNVDKVHTTLNLSRGLIREAERLFKDKSKTDLIHEALRRMIQVEKLDRHFRKWQGKGSFTPYD